MKKSEIEKSNFPFIVDVRDYLSTSMIIKNNLNKPNETGNDLLFIKSIERSENKTAFDLFENIIEG